MKIKKIDRRTKYLEVVPETLDDLWHLERIVEKGDLVKGQTTRVLPPKTEGGKKERINMFLELEVEKVSFDKYGPSLRVLGVIVGGKPEDLIELKAHHTLEINLHDELKVEKKELMDWQVERLKKAEKDTKKAKLLLIAMDDERADFALVKAFGLDEIGAVFSGKSGKMFKSEDTQNKYFSEVAEKIKGVECEKVIVAGPGLTKKYFQEYLKDKKLGKSFFFDSISTTGITGLNEIVKRGIVDKVQEESTVAEENKLMEKLEAEIFKESKKVVYGLKEVQKAAEMKAVSELYVTDELLFENREKIQELMSAVEKNRGKIHLISFEHDAGKRLKGFTGIAALLWFEI